MTWAVIQSFTTAELVAPRCESMLLTRARSGDAQYRGHSPVSAIQLWPDIVEGLRVVVRNPILRATTLASMTWNLFSGGVLDAIYVLYLSRDL